MSYFTERLDANTEALKRSMDAATAREARSKYGLIDLLADGFLLAARGILYIFGITENEDSQKHQPELRYRGISQGTASLVFKKK